MTTGPVSYDIVVIGGGASGLMFAASLDMRGRRGAVLEKTGRTGTKLLMSGGGRCNITHGGMIRDFVSAYGESGPALRKCLYRHSNRELAGWLEDHGIALADEKGALADSSFIEDAGRVFPASMKASDVLNVLLDQAALNRWEIRRESDVYDLVPPSPDCTSWKVLTSHGVILADNVVIASGGITFPETGSDGSMLEIVRRLGAEVTEPRSALAPVYVEDYPYGELSGISLPDVTAVVYRQNRGRSGKSKPVRMTGDLLFTHRGFPDR